MRMMIEPKDCGHETHLWMLMTTMVITAKKKKMVMMTVTKIVGEVYGGETLGQPSSATTTNQSQAVAAVAQTLA